MSINDIITILMFADDIALLAENEGDLQKMMDKLHSLCDKWKMVINEKKTQAKHFRPLCIKCTEHYCLMNLLTCLKLLKW